MIKKILLIGVPVFIVATILAQLIIAAGNSPERTGLSSASSDIVVPLPDATQIENRINAFRSEKGLSQLGDSSILDRAAMARAEGMCATNDWSHNKDWEVLTQYYTYDYAGENLYYGFLQPEQERVAVENWIASPTHYANVVGNYNEIGIAVKACPGFQGEPTAIIITNYFGVPR